MVIHTAAVAAERVKKKLERENRGYIILYYYTYIIIHDTLIHRCGIPMKFSVSLRKQRKGKGAFE